MIFFGKHSPSVRKEFFLIACTVICITLASSLWLSWNAYKNQSHHIIEELEYETARAEKAFTNSLDYTTYLMESILSQISHDKWNDYVYIDQLLTSFRINTELDTKLDELDIVLSWNMFTWSDEHYKVRVNSYYRILTVPKDISSMSIIHETRKKPRKLLVGAPIVGPISNQWIIPASMGAVDEKGNYRGAIGIGFNIKGIERKLSNMINKEGINFVLLSTDKSFIAASSPHHFSDKDTITKALSAIDLNTKPDGIIFAPHLFDNHKEYIAYKRLLNYPYIVLTTYNKKFSQHAVWKAVAPRITELLIVAFTLIALLVIAYKRLITPVVELSSAAEHIAKGEENVQVPVKSTHREIVHLSDHLKQVIVYIQKLKAIEKELEEKNLAAESANRAKSEFMACISHELRTPLNAIIGYSDMIRQGAYGPVNNDKYKEYLDYIHQGASQLLKAINDILDISRAEAGMVTLKKEPIVIEEMINNCIDMIASDAHKGNVTLLVKVAANLPPVMADKMRLKQIIMHLLSNAIKFTPAGGSVTVSAFSSHYHHKGHYCHISVIDTGIGMSKEDIAKALGNFSQVDSGLNRRFEGLGLGLPLTIKMVKLHQGELLIDSTIGQGTTVSVYLPIATDI